jgi:hypothetical protein
LLACNPGWLQCWVTFRHFQMLHWLSLGICGKLLINGVSCEQGSTLCTLQAWRYTDTDANKSKPSPPMAQPTAADISARSANAGWLLVRV